MLDGRDIFIARSFGVGGKLEFVIGRDGSAVPACIGGEQIRLGRDRKSVV